MSRFYGSKWPWAALIAALMYGSLALSVHAALIATSSGNPSNSYPCSDTTYSQTLTSTAPFSLSSIDYSVFNYNQISSGFNLVQLESTDTTIVYASSTFPTSYPSTATGTLTFSPVTIPASFLLDFHVFGWCNASVGFNVFGDASATVALDFPASSGPMADFAEWSVAWTNAPSSAAGGTIGVCYGLNPMTGCEASDTSDFSPFVNVSPLTILKHQQLWYPPLAVPAVWDAYAFLKNNSGAVIATSSVLTFYIDPGIASTTETVNCNATSSGGFWNQAVTDVSNGVCIALSFAFVPDGPHQRAITSGFQAIGNSVKNKPPFGYVTSAITALQSFNESTSTATTTIADATTTAEIYTVTGPLDQGIAVVIGFMLITWIFHRGRHFEPT